MTVRPDLLPWTVVWEDTEPVLMTRIQTHDGTNLLQADVTSIEAMAYNESDDSQNGTTQTLSASSVVFDTLQTDSRWTADTTGYNFRYQMPAEFIPTGTNSLATPTMVVVEIRITVTGDVLVPVPFRFQVQGLRSS